jgi:carbonic anhydrase
MPDANESQPAPSETPYQRFFRRNGEWAAAVTRDDPTFFARHAAGQKPSYLFIGCSDSRVPAEVLTGAEPGEMFVHRNIANLVVHADINLLSVLHYAVDVLQVQGIVVCGHYGCGGVRAAMGTESHGFVDHWLRGVRDVMRLHEDALATIPDEEARYRRLVELNASEQGLNLWRSPVVQEARARGQALELHAAVYDIGDGRLLDLTSSASDAHVVPDSGVSTWLEAFEPRSPDAGR